MKERIFTDRIIPVDCAVKECIENIAEKVTREIRNSNINSIDDSSAKFLEMNKTLEKELAKKNGSPGLEADFVQKCVKDSSTNLIENFSTCQNYVTRCVNSEKLTIVSLEINRVVNENLQSSPCQDRNNDADLKFMECSKKLECEDEREFLSKIEDKEVEDVIDKLLELSEKISRENAESKKVDDLQDVGESMDVEAQFNERSECENASKSIVTEDQNELEQDSSESRESLRDDTELNHSENLIESDGKGGKKKSKKEKGRELEEEKNDIHSETQRLIRESAVTLPYHHPKQMSLKEFLNRKKSMPVLSGTPKNYFYSSTPNEKNKKQNLQEIETAEPSEKCIDVQKENMPCVDAPTVNENQLTTPLQELKQNLMTFRKLLSADLSPVCDKKEPVIDLSRDIEPVGVQQLINRFMKHASKPSTPSAPKTCALNIVSKEMDDSGKEVLKNEQINVHVSPSKLQCLPTAGPKITELKSKLRSIISMKKMKEREKRLLAHKLDNEEGQEFDGALLDEEDMDMREKSDKENDDSSDDDDGKDEKDSDGDAEEDMGEDLEDEIENEDGSGEEESEIDENDEDDDDDIALVCKRKSKRCLFLDDEADESGDEACGEETDDDDICSKEMVDKDVKDEVSAKEMNKQDEEQDIEENHDCSQKTTILEDEQVEDEATSCNAALLPRDTDSSFEMIGSLFPAAQPFGGQRYKDISITESENDDLKSTCPGNSFEECSQEIPSLDPNYSQEIKGFGKSVLKEDEDKIDENDLLGFCSGRFTGITQKLSQDNELQNENDEADESSSDDESELLIGRRRIVKKPTLILQNDNDSDESQQNFLSNEENEENGFSDNEATGRRKRGFGFFEEEAELSGSDLGSEDEVEEGDDEYEAEGLTDEVLNEDKLRDEIGKVHFKTMLDADKKELRFFQEMYLEDGDLHSDGQGRQRKFRWKNMDNSQDENDVKNTSEGEEEKEDEEGETWRVNRYEREKWLHEQKALQVSPSPKKSLSLNVKFVNRNVNEKPATQGVKLNEAVGMSGQRSYLFRDRQYFSLLAEKYNKVEDDKVGKRATKNFVFRTTSPVKTAKPAMKRSLSAAVVPNNAKKVKAAPQRSNSVFDLF